MKVFMEELHTKGHNLTVLRFSSSWYIREKSDLFTSITLPMTGEFVDVFQKYLDDQMKVCDLLLLFTTIQIVGKLYFNNLYSFCF